MVFDYSRSPKILFCRVAGKSKWIKVEKKLVAKGTNRTSRLQITSKKKGVVWFDQVSLMPEDTYKVSHEYTLWLNKHSGLSVSFIQYVMTYYFIFLQANSVFFLTLVILVVHGFI
jgi:hypothetical protein